jgi:hypothetical protein
MFQRRTGNRYTGLWCGGAVLFCLCLAAPVRTVCQDKPPKPGAVSVSVVAILASERDTFIDPRVACIAREVRKLHPNLKGFRMAKMSCKSVAVGGVDDFGLVADQHAMVTVLKPANKANRVQLKVTPPTLGEITYTTCCGKFFPMLTHYQTKNQEWLIVAVRVQTCNGKK